MIFIVLAAALLFQEQPQMFTVAGKVVDATTHAPLARARVVVTTVEQSAPQPGRMRQAPPSRSAITGADGAFGFLNVPAGKYQLSAALPGRPPQMYLSDGSQYSTAVATGAGVDTEHLVFPYHAGGTIVGVVADESGEPVRPQVHLFRKSMVDGRERVMQAGAGASVSEGKFRFGHLQAGEYYVAVTATPWYANYPVYGSSFGTPPAPRELDVAYSLTYYPGTSDFASATPIAITDGSTANVQISLRGVPAVHLTLPQTNNNYLSVTAMGPDGNPMPMLGGVHAKGVLRIAPGTYSVGTDPQRQGARQIVHLTGDSTVEPATAVSPSISGKVTVEGSAAPGNRVMVLLQGTGVGASAQAKEDGSFDFKDNHLSGGRYRLIFPNNPLFFVKDVTATGGTLADGEIELKDNSTVQLNVVLAQTSQSKIEGKVVRNGEPLAAAMVLLLPVKDTGADLTRRDQSDLDGSFSLLGVPPGEYRLLAVDNGRDLAYRDKAVMRAYLAKATKIQVPSANGELTVEAQSRIAK